MTRRFRILALGCLLVPGGGMARAEGLEWLERWLFNPQERTRQAIDASQRGEPAETLESLDVALRLDEASPVARFNAGTGRLTADRSGAEALFRTVAEQGAARDLLASTHYNLGNARLKESDFLGAVEAYEESLRLRPDFADAKFNLELARRLLEEQQESESEEADEEEQDQDEQDQQQQQDQQQDQQQQEQEPQQDEDQQGEEQGREQEQSHLPQFRDLPDMTAEEAAAILEAVENMERERRRQEALDAARTHARGKKDW